MSSILAVSLLGGCRASDKPVTLTVWTYYNGDQLASFERLVEEFNTTIGKKEHITVEASSQGSINDLEKNVLDAAKGRVGALAMPNIFSAYAGSTSSATFFPNQVATSYSDAHSISMKVLPCQKFADGEAYAVQQGAGMVVTQGSEQEIKACVTFLKWFTAPENNITFSADSSYLPDNQTV